MGPVLGVFFIFMVDQVFVELPLETSVWNTSGNNDVLVTLWNTIGNNGVLITLLGHSGGRLAVESPPHILLWGRQHRGKPYSSPWDNWVK